MDKIKIVNFLLTRKCNLSCEYCRISRNYEKPDEYPTIEYYNKNEIDTDSIKNFLTKLKKHNPDIFVIFYGGEPFYRKDLSDIINFCNSNIINYTIITNNSDKVQKNIRNLIHNTKNIMGLSSSVDPIIFSDFSNSDIYNKSISGLRNLILYKAYINDPVAEITVTQDNIKNLKNLVRKLTDNYISSSITFIDVAKSKYYDFSNITEETNLVKPTNDNIKIIEDLYLDDELNILMREELLYFKNILPSNMNCEIENDINNLTVDSDGSIRLCLRIRSVLTPELYNINNIFMDDFSLNPLLKKSITDDKKIYCKKCNWTCMLMSKIIT